MQHYQEIESWKWIFHKGQYFKPSNINLASVSKHVRSYRPEEKKLRIANGCKCSFCQSKTEKQFQIWLLLRFPIMSENA